MTTNNARRARREAPTNTAPTGVTINLSATTWTAWTMLRYTLTRTIQRCECCSSVSAGSLSHVPYVDCINYVTHEQRSFKLQEIQERFARLANRPLEEGTLFLPKLPVKIKRAVVTVPWCAECFEAEFAKLDPVVKFPPIVPQIIDRSNPKRPTTNLDDKINAKPAKRSRSIHPKRERDPKLEKLAKASLTDLFASGKA